jgi:hypothetical protein
MLKVRPGKPSATMPDLVSARLAAVAISALLAAWSGACLADHVDHQDARNQAKRIHDRLTGTLSDTLTLSQMVTEIEVNHDPQAAAFIAMQNRNFYNVTLKNMATPWTNRDQTVFAPLNDYTATFIGMVRDNVGMDQLLSINRVYHAEGATVDQPIPGDPGTAPDYSAANNNHYEWLENNGVDLAAELDWGTQTEMTGLPDAATAGVMTTRGAAAAFFIAGTNRAMFRFTLLNHLCTDLEQVKDTTRSPDRVRQDVSRSPGGDSRLFQNNCVGCHSGMDPMAQAFAYYQFNEASGEMEYTFGNVQDKYTINNETFSPGFITPDDSWDNYWRQGPNEWLIWGPGDGSGSGAKSMGQEMANSRAFASCQVKKVFTAVCLREPSDGQDRSMIDDWTDNFIGADGGQNEMGGYKLKPVFAEAAAYCMGEPGS